MIKPKNRRMCHAHLHCELLKAFPLRSATDRICEAPLPLSIVLEILASTIKQKRGRKRKREEGEDGRKT